MFIPYKNRDVHCPSNFIEAISKVNDLYDLFTCPNTHHAWHEKALRLVLAIEEPPSQRMTNLMKLDLQDILKENGIL